MEKLSKAQLQKGFLGCLLFCGVFYSYFQFLIAPLDRMQGRLESDARHMEQRIQEAGGMAGKLNELRIQADEARDMLVKIDSLVPKTQPVVWFPPRVRSELAKEGITDVDVTETAIENINNPVLSQFQDITWTVTLPRVDFLRLARAVACVEANLPIARITRLRIALRKDDVENQEAAFQCITTVRP